MLNLGKWNELRIVRFTDHGAYLDGGDDGEVLMPKAYVKDEMHPDDIVRVFVYLDQSERPVATTERPKACVGEFACLQVAWVNDYGAFLDWGLMKDLFVPFRGQRTLMKVGEWHIVYIYVDEETNRIVGTTKVDKHLHPATPEMYHRGSEVEFMVEKQTPLGYKVIVDNAHPGLLYSNQLFGQRPRRGDRLSGTVTAVRPDGKLDVTVGKIGKGRFRDFATELLDALEDAGGFLPVTDHTSPEEIDERFGVSKKTFKRAVGTLYAHRKILIEENGIRLSDNYTSR